MATHDDNMRTPIEKAIEARQYLAEHSDEIEAATVLEDVEDYVAETDPAGLPAAASALSGWSVPAEPPVPADAGDFVVARTVASEWEGAIFEGILEDAGIPARVAGRRNDPQASFLSVGDGAWGVVLTPASMVDKANAALDAAQIDASGADADHNE